MYNNKKYSKRLSLAQTPLLAIIISSFIWACKDNTLSPADELSSALSGDVNTYVQDGLEVEWEGNRYNYTESYRGVPVSLVEKTNKEDTIIAQVDPGLVALYNSTYSENNSAIPDGAFQASHEGKFVVEAQSLVSKDSLYIELKDASQLSSGHLYLVPVRLTSIRGNKLNYAIIFFKLKLKKVTLGSYLYSGAIDNATNKPYFRSGSLYFHNSVYRVNGIPQGPRYVMMNVGLNFAFYESDIQVEATLMNDEQTIQEFSRRSGSSFVPFPEETFKLIKNQVEIKKGNILSTDSLRVELLNKEKFSSSTWYLLGLKLKKIEGSTSTVSPMSSDSSMAYISFFVN